MYKTFILTVFLLTITLLLGVLPMSDTHAANKRVRMGNFVMNPMVTIDDKGQLGGPLIGITRHIADLEGWDLQIVQCTFSRCLEMLETGEIDIATPVAYTKERAKKFGYSKETLLMDWGQIYARDSLNIHSLLELEGKRVVTIKSTVFNNKFTELLKSFDINVEFIRVDDYLDVFRYVQDDKADAMIINHFFGEKNIGDFSKVAKTPIIFQPIDIRYAAIKGANQEVLDILDEHLQEMKSDHLSEYHMEINSMLGQRSDIYGIMQKIRWVLFVAGALLLFIIIMNMYLRRKVSQRTSELRQEVGERKQAEQALFESRESFKTLVEFTSAIHWKLDIASGKFTYVSPQADALLGYPAEQWTDMAFWLALIHEDDRQWAGDYCMAQTEECKDHEFIYRALSSDGKIVWLHDIVKVIMGPKGPDGSAKPEKLIGIMFDITEQKEAEANLEKSLREKEVLLKEVHHRVKNNMAIISSLSNLQSYKIKDEKVKAALREGRSRIRTMALVHEQLYQSDNFSEIELDTYLHRLVENVKQSYAEGHREEIRIDCDELSLDMDTLIPCGLIINELLTNAIKYAYEPGEAGEILVSMKKTTEDGYLLEVRDWGKGFDGHIGPDDEIETLGMQLVLSLVNQIDGHIDINGEGGMHVSITFDKPESYVELK